MMQTVCKIHKFVCRLRRGVTETGIVDQLRQIGGVQQKDDGSEDRPCLLVATYVTVDLRYKILDRERVVLTGPISVM